MPCKTVAAALTTSKPFVKFQGATSTTDEAVVISGGKQVTFLADPGAKLTHSGSAGAIITTQDAGSELAVYDLTITKAPNDPTGVGLNMTSAGGMTTVSLARVNITNNPGGGISASGGTLTLAQSTVSGNTGGGISASGGTITISRSFITGNSQNGISISGSQFDITNSIIAGNGSPQSSFGGVRIDQASTGTRRFDFNTVTNNSATDGSAVGVVCTLIAQPLTLSDSIVYANQVGGTRTQVGGANCNWRFSDIGPDTVGGAGNLNVDPLFVNPSQNDFHIQATSPVKDKADPNATVTIDVDGDVRPQGSGFDMGADEIK